MTQDDEKTGNSFTERGALIGFFAYLILIFAIIAVFLL